MFIRFFQLLLISFCFFSFSQISVNSSSCPEKSCPVGYIGVPKVSPKCEYDYSSCYKGKDNPNSAANAPKHACVLKLRNLVPPKFSGSLRACDGKEERSGASCNRGDACISADIKKASGKSLEAIKALADMTPTDKAIKTFSCQCNFGKCKLEFEGIISTLTSNLPICPAENGSTANATCSPGLRCKKAEPESFSIGELKDGWRELYRCDCF